MNKLVTIFFLCHTLSTVYAQKQQDLSGITNKIKAINEVQYESVGLVGTPSDNYKNYLVLKNKANIQQLVKLTDDTNAVIVCYASWALIEKSYNDLPSILIKFLNKDRDVATFSGCIKSSDPLSSEFYHKYWNSLDKQLRPANKTLFTLDSLILYNDNCYWLLTTRALENRVYPTTFNKRIEYLAFTKANNYAITYLKKLNDKTYSEQIKQAVIKYFKQTNFQSVGIGQYLETITELLNYQDKELKDLIIAKLNQDKFWRSFKKEFLSLLKKYGINESEIK